MLTGTTHNECEPTGTIAQNASRFENLRYQTVQLRCCKCRWLFWSGQPNAVKLAAARGFTFAH
jgi:hypothetical protein